MHDVCSNTVAYLKAHNSKDFDSSHMNKNTETFREACYLGYQVSFCNLLKLWKYVCSTDCRYGILKQSNTYFSVGDISS